MCINNQLQGFTKVYVIVFYLNPEFMLGKSEEQTAFHHSLPLLKRHSGKIDCDEWLAW